ncbi:MAG: hypothetical protein PHF86_09180 [Candidatus Nanoarchaeia archaeon]|nr:hypothetical protein [Candidatus Nanoarchaeia archaeon]
MSRKGMSETVLVSLIVLLAGVLVLGYATNLIAGNIKSKTDIEICRQSIQLNAQKVLGIQKFSTPINCPSNNFTIKDEKSANKDIANAMYDCWYKFGEGELDFMGSDKGSFCYLCSKINFDDSLKDKELDGLGNYLLDTKTSAGQTYADYLFTHPNYLDLTSLNKIPTTNPLYVMYIFDTTNYPRQKGLETYAKGAVISCVSAGAIGLIGGGISAIPACAIGAGGFVFLELVFVNPSANQVKFKPSVALISSTEATAKCSGATSPWENLFKGISNAGEGNTEGQIL